MDVLTLARRAALAVAAGAALFAAHPPLGVGWLALVAVAPLAALGRDLAAHRRPLRSAFGWGTVAGVAFFGPLLVWIVHIQELVAWLLLVPVQAAFVGAFLALVVAWGPRRGRVAVVVVAWVAVEAVRSAVPLGGFPWGVLGYTQADGGPLLGIARSFGVLGVSAACAAVGALLEDGGHRLRAAARTGRSRRRSLAGAATAAVLLASGLLAAGALPTDAQPAPGGAAVDVLGVQGYDAEGSTGRSRARSARVAASTLAVTAGALDEGDRPELVVWAENAFDGDPRTSAELAGILGSTLDLLDGTPLLTGVIEEGPRRGTHRNSVLLYEGSPESTGRYAKRRLVPFGEFVPARRLLGWFPALERVPSDGIPGADPTVLEVAGARVGVGICFDVVFPHLFRQQARAGADVLVLATNNISYGRSAMSDQHIAFSQLRAVETGRWVVHVALSGRSAIVDPSGRVHQRTGQYEQATVRAEVPLVRGTTLAMRVGDGVGWAAGALVLLGAGWLLVDRRRGVAAPVQGDAAAMTSDDHPAPEPTDREDVADQIDARDPIDDLDDEAPDGGRDEDQAWAGTGAMEGQQPSG